VSKTTIEVPQNRKHG